MIAYKTNKNAQNKRESVYGGFSEKRRGRGINVLKNNKILVFIAIFVIICVACYVFCGNGAKSDGGFDGVKNAYNQVAGEQREVSDKLGKLRSGITDNQKSADELEQLNNGLKQSANQLGEYNNTIKESVNRSTEINGRNAEIIAENRERLARCEQIVNDLQRGNETKNSNSQ